jgi:hypothetical protein
MRYFSLLFVALATPLVLAAQVVTVDEGSFTISRGGARVGRENFTIRKTPGPGGDMFVANATINYDSQRLSPALRTDNSFSPLAYQVEVRSGDAVQERLKGLVGRGRFSAQLMTPQGESAKEYVVSDGALVLDDDVFHQYYFLAQKLRDGSGSVAVVVPRRNVQETMRVQANGTERLAIGGVPFEARQIILTEPGGATRRIWVDAQGRVLRVSLEGRGVVAQRDDPPR